MNDDEFSGFDISFPDHALLWDTLKARFTGVEDENLLFCIDPKNPKRRVMISKCPYCERANTSNMGDKAKYDAEPLQQIVIQCKHCNENYNIQYEIVAIPYKTTRI